MEIFVNLGVRQSCKLFETVVTSKQNFFNNQICAGTKKPRFKFGD